MMRLLLSGVVTAAILAFAPAAESRTAATLTLDADSLLRRRHHRDPAERPAGRRQVGHSNGDPGRVLHGGADPARLCRHARVRPARARGEHPRRPQRRRDRDRRPGGGFPAELDLHLQDEQHAACSSPSTPRARSSARAAPVERRLERAHLDDHGGNTAASSARASGAARAPVPWDARRVGQRRRKVSLAFKGKRVHCLTTGRYSLSVIDKSPKSGFVLERTKVTR